MRARIEQAVAAERRTSAKRVFQDSAHRLLSQLASAVISLQQRWPEQQGAFFEVESCDDLPYWTKPELPDIVAALCALEELVEGVATTATQADRAAAPAAAAAADLGGQSDSAAAEGAGRARSASRAGRSDELLGLYTGLVDQLINDLVVPSAQSFADAICDGTLCEGAVVRVLLASDASGLFPLESVAVVPVVVYVAWRCTFRLCDGFQRLLRVPQEDAAACWLDVTSAMLASLDGASQQCLRVSSAEPRTGTDAPPRACGWSSATAAGAAAAVQVTHCCWWWWSFTFATGVRQRWLCPAADAARNDGHATACDGLSDTTGDLRGEFAALWRAGQSVAARHLSAVVRPPCVRLLEASMAALVLGFHSVRPDTDSAKDTATRVRAFYSALDAVERVAEQTFPHAGAPPTTHDGSPTPGSSLPSAPLRCDGAPSLSFLRVVVHDALRPLAERVLDNPAALLAGQRGSRSHAVAASPPASPTAAGEGWGEEGDSEEWEEVTVLPKGEAPSSCSSLAPSPSAAPTSHGGGGGGGKTALVQHGDSAPVIVSAHDALSFVLDTLEQRLAEAVRGDAVAMTLRRLL